LPREEKIRTVAEFKERVLSHAVSVATGFQGLTAGEATDLRKRLRQAQVQFTVFKNTLVRLALNELGLSDATRFLEGPTAWAFSRDPYVVAKVLREYSKEVDKVAMRGGVLDGRVINAAQLEALATLPPRDVLLSQVVGCLALPIRNLLGVLSAPCRNLVHVLDQIRKQTEEKAAA